MDTGTWTDPTEGATCVKHQGVSANVDYNYFHSMTLTADKMSKSSILNCPCEKLSFHNFFKFLLALAFAPVLCQYILAAG